ncbi:MAG: Spy/CpxP family protein refolding chaperone [Acidobacteria bacterium]|nr:Spy/CpxP family protein refolding chaperone [Acidobacteriota bacterium]
MKKAILGIIAVAVVATGAIIGFSQVRVQKDGDPSPGMRHGRGGHRMGMGMGIDLRGLDLTEDQKAKVKAIFEANRESMKPMMADMKANRQKFADLNKNVFDEGATTQLANEQASIMAKMIVERERVKSQVWAILTDAQKAKATEMRSVRHERKVMRKVEEANDKTPQQ